MNKFFEHMLNQCWQSMHLWSNRVVAYSDIISCTIRKNDHFTLEWQYFCNYGSLEKISIIMTYFHASIVIKSCTSLRPILELHPYFELDRSMHMFHKNLNRMLTTSYLILKIYASFGLRNLKQEPKQCKKLINDE